MDIKHINREDIDDKRWNGCVHYAKNSMPYSYTWYLDQVAPEWSGLVLGRYQAVFPLVQGKKWGFSYLYTPLFVQQLGLYGITPITASLQKRFLNAIPKSISYVDYLINDDTLPEGHDYTNAGRVNYELDLRPAYQEIRKGYSGNVLRTIKKAEKAGLKFTNQISPEKTMAFYREHTASKIKGFNDFYFHAMHRVIYQALQYGMGSCYGVLTPDDKLIATNFFLQTPRRIINLLPASSAMGRDKGAMPYLIDAMVRLHAGHAKVFDFEGSMVPSVAEFYRRFGADTKNYQHIKRNLLPIPFKWVK